MSQSNNSSDIRGPLIGCVGAIVAAIIGGIFLVYAATLANQANDRNAASLVTATAVARITPPPAPTYTPLPTPVPPTPYPTSTPYPTYTPLPTPTPRPANVIPFGSPNNPKGLNPVFGWQQGNSIANAYELTTDPYVLILTAGSGTGQWGGSNTAPMVIYPMKGNFETQVKMASNPPEGSGQLTDLGIRSAKNGNMWLRIGKWGR